MIVGRSMEGVGAALGHHLDLTARGAGEIGGLVTGADLELLDALNRSRHDARGRASGGSGAGVAVTWRVRPLVAVHVAAVVAAVQLKTILVLVGAGGISESRDTHLQRGQGGGIAAQVG